MTKNERIEKLECQVASLAKLLGYQINVKGSLWGDLTPSKYMPTIKEVIKVLRNELSIGAITLEPLHERKITVKFNKETKNAKKNKT